MYISRFLGGKRRIDFGMHARLPNNISVPHVSLSVQTSLLFSSLILQHESINNAEIMKS
jgi:hypothetical protein